MPFYFINVLPISLLYISTLLAEAEPTNDPNDWLEQPSQSRGDLRYHVEIERGCCLLLQYLIPSCARGGRRIVEDMCYEIRRAEACVD